MAALDDLVGVTVQSLKDAGLFDNSIIVFTSDVSLKTVFLSVFMQFLVIRA